METLVNTKQAAYIDSSIQSSYKISSMLLMERAASAVYEVISDKGLLGRGLTFGILCGNGNNSGDGLAIARQLFMSSEKVLVYMTGRQADMSDSATRQYSMVKELGIFQSAFIDEFSECDVIIDALFGIGLSRNIEGDLRLLIDKINTFKALKIAIDMPSGIDSATGSVMGTAFKADFTVTFGYKKTGQLLDPGRQYCGSIYDFNIGLNAELIKNFAVKYYALDKSDLTKCLSGRREDGNKSTFGKVLIIAGSANISGAAFLSAKAALKSGCGMVRIYTAVENRTILAGLLPEALIDTYDTDFKSEDLKKACQWADIIVFGPGIGTGKNSSDMLNWLIKNTDLPLIIDADGLNLLAVDPERIDKYRGQVILTPHMGEMSRLIQRPIDEIKKDRLNIAENFALEHNAVVVLKDSVTVTAVPFKNTYLNTSGNSGLATAGSGDVLTGIIASLFVNKPDETSIAAAVYLHGRCADEYAGRCDPITMTASDIIDMLRPAIESDFQK